NLQFSAPLEENEVMGIAKSVAKWTNKNLTESGFSEYVKKTHTPDIQAKRGRLGGEKSKGGGRPSTTGKKWIEEGISRSSWYRKKATQL
ncbi:replication initiation protein, partial [Escherichia coli]